MHKPIVCANTIFVKQNQIIIKAKEIWFKVGNLPTNSKSMVNAKKVFESNQKNIIEFNQAFNALNEKLKFAEPLYYFLTEEQKAAEDAKSGLAEKKVEVIEVAVKLQVIPKEDVKTLQKTQRIPRLLEGIGILTYFGGAVTLLKQYPISKIQSESEFMLYLIIGAVSMGVGGFIVSLGNELSKPRRIYAETVHLIKKARKLIKEQAAEPKPA